MIGTAIFVTSINISMVVLWVPARLQVSHSFQFTNMVWDRIEKVLYLLVDAGLNWYFLRTVKSNLINNGLAKYDKLASFNKKIIGLSLSMDIMINAAMSTPDPLFHPLAYLVKLNIKMVIANLIKRIAVSTARKTGQADIAKKFESNSSNTLSKRQSYTLTQRDRNGHYLELESVASLAIEGKSIHVGPANDQIKQTTKVVTSRDSDSARSKESCGPEV